MTSLTKAAQVDGKKLVDMIQTSMAQHIRSISDGEVVIKFLDNNLQVDKLSPVGTHLTFRITVDVYPKDNSPT